MTSSLSAAPRIASIDIMRGAAIMLMMLDHVRERFYMHVRTGDPMYDTIEPDLFFTRLLAHFCAPVFIFLAGVSAWTCSSARARSDVDCLARKRLCAARQRRSGRTTRTS
jgi:uncharacterized membrane protein